MAAFIRGDADAPAVATDKLLERLTLPSAAAQPVAVVATPEPMNEAATAKLAQLTKTEPAAPAPSAPSKAAAPAEDLSKANEKLSSLLGGKPK